MKRTTMRARAEAIINNRRAYDVDTRRAVELSLARTRRARLRETVRRAEAGDTICDLTDSALSRRELAGHIAAVIANPDAPRPQPAVRRAGGFAGKARLD